MKHEIDLSKYQTRTDLITETIKEDTNATSYHKEIEQQNGITIETLYLTKEAEEILHKKEGIYKTIFFEDVTDETNQNNVQQAFEKAIQDILQKEKIKSDATCLVIGLGNRKATPDALGPLTVDQITITRHLYTLGLADETYRNVAAIAPGVMGTTGIETKDIILGLLQQIKPDFLIAIDALAAGSIARIHKTIQITNTGIHPGSGIGNNRQELSKDTIHIPVIAIGIPTVVDAVTIVSNTISYLFEHLTYEKEHQNDATLKFITPYQQKKHPQKDNLTQEEKEKVLGQVGMLDETTTKQLIAEVLMPLGYNLIVTPKEIDLLIDKLSQLLAKGLNKTLHQH